MARQAPRQCHHKRSGIAYVTDPALGREVYLKCPDGTPARYGTPEADAAYNRWLQGFLARAAPKVLPGASLTVDELLDGYLRYAEGYYRKRGAATSEVKGLAAAARYAREGRGRLPAGSFGPPELKAARQAMIAAGLARSTVNTYAGKLVRAWRWGVSEGVVQAEALTRLEAVPALARGRTAAREPDDVPPAPLEHVAAALPHLRPKVADLVRLQLAGSMRPGEACAVRPLDVGRQALPWRYAVAGDWNKTDHKDRARTVFLGPQARAVLGPYLDRCASPEAFAFPARGGKRPYSTGALYNAVLAACAKAGVPRWAPNQLRHAQATVIRAHYGAKDGPLIAQAVLGHANLQTTATYAQEDEGLARRAAEELG